MRTVRALGLGRQSYIKIEKKVDLYAESQEKMVSTFALFHPTVTIGTGVLILLLIGMGIPMLDSGQIKTGQWVAVLSYILLLQQPLIEISDRWNFFISGITGVQRILEVLNSPLEKSEGRLAPEFSSLTLNGVSFRYPDAGSLALSSLSLEINRGDWVGVFGESGSGKTTFLQLLYRFYEPTEGVLLWNQEPIEELDRHSIRSRFGVVEQFPFLYSGSIRENITLFGRFQFDEKELLRTFNGFPLIHSLLSNLDRLVSERGYNLSMGERQMITFLRAWIAKPLIWILDEATAFFDERAEAELLRALDALKPIGVTVIQVAHRPEALKRMNRLFKVQQGEFLELESDFSLQSKDLP
jgi:ABC-type multidrug transport system fused ATPase/permease subunit